MEAVKNELGKSSLKPRGKSLWRYREVLPVLDDRNITTLGEGYTPILPLRVKGKPLMKDDGLIPTGTFKARGLSVAVSKAKELGIKGIAMPSAGNAGAALACYAARARIPATVYLPSDAPRLAVKECEAHGATTVLIEGTISDAAKAMRALAVKEGYFDMSTMREPYRVEGKKTMGYEMIEQLGYSLPDAVIYPTGGGTGLVGMWKAFEETEELGWIGSERPRMISVQAEGCAPIVEAFKAGRAKVEKPFAEPHTIASGLRVPEPFASDQILKVIRESKGSAVAVSDHEILDSIRILARGEGILACPEGAATLAGYKRLLDSGDLGSDETVILYNTGSGSKYPDLL